MVFLGMMKKKNSVLSVLLNLECLVLLMFMWFAMKHEMFFSPLFLSVGACEAAVGLSVLVSMNRDKGSMHLFECGI
uniref:NADH dehydrogenase subunit 4L n=1 Tax=Flaccisagitta enflata TaxID=366393 RepID=D3DKN9_9BILA|nr:NADH dehydrogenase subunit 4L [Flaccisagitta enflata]BAI68188.1 NADH dehydrogenase subunit 4L [Flaccisagitta enflata]